jgi:hypothetical protein
MPTKNTEMQIQQPQVIVGQYLNPGKNLPNALLRKATGGTQGRQTSIGALSHYKSSASNNGVGQTQLYQQQIEALSQDIVDSNSGSHNKFYKNTSLEDLAGVENQ